MSKNVLRMIRTPLSDSDLRKIIGQDLKIILYRELSSILNLREMLTTERDCMVALYEEKELSGH